MSFDSLAFFVFLPIVFSGYWLLASSYKRQNCLIVVASYVFYGWWDWRFLILIAFTSGWVFVSGLFDSAGCRGTAKLRLVLSLIVNLGVLCFFKYFNFFLDSFCTAFRFLVPDSQGLAPSSLNIILPVGISFYTFQALSYSIDVYRGSIKPTRDPVAFFAYISFFPQLVAGPIERATNLLPQFHRLRRFDYPLAVEGCRQMIWGFFKKVLVADSCAVAANAILGSSVTTSVSLWIGMILFAFQIYGDFSGYSDIAIGCSKLFGIRLMRNFAMPYFSRDIAEFWRRWHISLTTWFRDYLYIPLGGSRCGTWKKIRNTFVIFLVSGFWHGANWTFVLWGLFHAVCFVPLLVRGTNRKHVCDVVSESRFLPTFSESCGMAATFVLAVVGWTFFRAPDITAAFAWLGKMLTFSDMSTSFCNLAKAPHAFYTVLALLTIEWFNRKREIPALPTNRVLRWIVYYVTLFVLLRWKADPQAFIYFQF